MPTDRGVDKEDVVRTHNRVLLSHKKAILEAICISILGGIYRVRVTRTTSSDKLRALKFLDDNARQLSFSYWECTL